METPELIEAIDKPAGHSLDIELSRTNAGRVGAADNRPEAFPRTGSLGSPASHGKILSEQWFVARHRPYRGPITAERIHEAGFPVILPRQVVQRPRQDDVLVPVFPGYMFVRFALSSPVWGRLFSERIGLLSILVNTARVPMALPMGFVEEFMTGADENGVFPHYWPGDPPVRASDRIGRTFKVTAGPWRDFVGRCTAANRNKTSLLLDLFGRQVVAELRPDQIREVQQ